MFAFFNKLMTDQEFIVLLESWLSEKFNQKCKILHIEVLQGGACQENSLIHLKFLNNHQIQKLIYRSDRGSALFASLPKQLEFKVLEIAYKNGVKVPKPFFLEETGTITGKAFYIMEALNGKADPKWVLKRSKFKFDSI